MSEWIAICGEDGGDVVEIETEVDRVLLLESVTAHFPGTTTLKFRNKEKTTFRGVKCIEGKMAPPTGGWDQASIYISVNPNKEEQAIKRKAQSEERESAKTSRHEQDPELDPHATVDLILLGLNPQTTEASIREYFEKMGDLTMLDIKKSKDANVGYAFIKFADKEVERKMLKEKHNIEGKQTYLKIPNSRHQGDRSERKVYVAYRTKELSEEDLRNHFEKFGDVEEVFIPTPWRHFCFVTFMEKRVAQSLLGKEHMLQGVTLLIKSLSINKEKEEHNRRRNLERGWDASSMGMMPRYGMGGMMPYGMDMGGAGDPRYGSGGWTGHTQHGYGQMMGGQGYARGFGGGRRN